MIAATVVLVMIVMVAMGMAAMMMAVIATKGDSMYSVTSVLSLHNLYPRCFRTEYSKHIAHMRPGRQPAGQ